MYVRRCGNFVVIFYSFCLQRYKALLITREIRKKHGIILRGETSPQDSPQFQDFWTPTSPINQREIPMYIRLRSSNSEPH